MDGAADFKISVAERVRAILAEQAMIDLADVHLDARLTDLGLDSLGLVESLFAIEEAFDISVPFNANEPSQNRFDVSTVKALIVGIEGLIATR